MKWWVTMKVVYSLLTRTDHLFLNGGVIFYFLNESGNIPVVIIWLIIKVKDLLNLVNFSSLLDIPSCPELFLFSRLSIAFNVSVSV